MPTPKQIEEAEKQAWQNMFDLAPESFRREMNLYYEHAGGGICQVFPKYPVVHFNMVMGLGFTEPVTRKVLERVEGIYREAGQPVYMIQFSDDIQSAEPAGVFEDIGYNVGGIWERIVWHAATVVPVDTNTRIEEVTAATVNDWADFIINLYRYPAREWLPALLADKWHHFIAIENDKIVACRSIFISDDNIAWSGVEAPVPVVMTDNMEPDRALWRHIQQFCLQQNVGLIAADIEKPSPGRDTPVYQSFADLGFTVAYPRKLYRKK